MISPKILDLNINLSKGSRHLVFTAESLVCAGNVGRDKKAVQAHIGNVDISDFAVCRL